MTVLELCQMHADAREHCDRAFDDLLEKYEAEYQARRDTELVAGRLAIEIAELRARVAELEAEVEAYTCDSCDRDCADCAARN